MGWAFKISDRYQGLDFAPCGDDILARVHVFLQKMFHRGAQSDGLVQVGVAACLVSAHLNQVLVFGYSDQRRRNRLASLGSSGESRFCITREIEPFKSRVG
jgi:hypothetical protein